MCLQQAQVSMASQPTIFPLGLSTVFWTVQEEEDKTRGPQSCEEQACMLGCLKDFCMGREQQNLTAEATAAPALLRSGCQLWNHAAQPLVFPITSPWEVGVSFPVPTFPSKSQSPFRHPGQRDTLFEREAGTYLRLRRVRLAQRAPISAATPVSLMELLCRLQTEERTHLVWLSQDLEGATSPAEALNFTGSWGGRPWGNRYPTVFFSSSLVLLPSPTFQLLLGQGRWV